MQDDTLSVYMPSVLMPSLYRCYCFSIKKVILTSKSLPTHSFHFGDLSGMRLNWEHIT